MEAFTRQKMVKAFWPYHPRTDKLLARRNWCDVTMAAPPFSAPSNPSEPSFGGLRFCIRAENPNKWHGYAEEAYEIFVPRAPGVGAPKEHWWRHRLHWRSDDQEKSTGGKLTPLAQSPPEVKLVTPLEVKTVSEVTEVEMSSPPVKTITDEE